MTFLFVLTYLGYAHLAFLVKWFVNRDTQKRRSFAVLFHLLAAMILNFGLLFMLVGEQRMQQFNWFVPAVLAFGLLSATLFSIKLVSHARKGSDGSVFSWRAGTALWGVLGGLYLTYTVIDSWRFFAVDPAHTGVANLEFIKASDVNCDRMAVARLGDVAVDYRCPTSVMFAWWSNHPFVPWPSYTEGRSTALKNEFDKMLNNPETVKLKPE